METIYKNRYSNIKKRSLVILMTSFLFLSSFKLFAQPPTATIIVDVSGISWVPQVSRVITANQVLLIIGNGTYFGSITVRNQGHVVVCGSTSIFGSVTIDAGGHYWKTPTTGFTGSLFNNGTLHNNASNCGGTAPEIDIQGNSITISDGDVTPNATDDTDFGDVAAASGSVTNTFTILNSGNDDLSISGAITSSDAQFTLTQPSSSTIAEGASETFTITFDPSSTGTQTSSIVIPNDDSNENPYNFNVTGEGTGPQPEISLKGLSGISIAHNDLTPRTEDGTSFGTQTASSGTKTQTYEISNSGPGVLNIGTIDIKSRGGNGNAYDTHYTVIQPISTTVASGSSVTFSVTFAPTAAVWAGRNDNAGNKAAYLRIPSDDPDGNYDFDIHGTGIAGDAFDCASGAMVLANANPTDWYSVDYNDLSLPLTTLNTTQNVMLDGVGINPDDGFIYGMRRDQASARNQLWVVADDGVRQFKGVVAGVGTAGSHTAGDFAADGYLYAKRDGNNALLQKIDVHGLSSTLITLSSSCNFKDMAYHSGNELFYAVSTAGTIGLISIDPGTGTVILIGNNGALNQNAVYASSDGAIYAQATTGVMYKWNLTDGSQEVASADPSYNLQSNLYDGASCGLMTLPGIPEIVIRGNGIEIIDGATTHALETGQSFGAHQMNSGSKTNTFWIVNEGEGDLDISGDIDIRSGSTGTGNAYDAQFTVVQPTSTSISAGDSVSFTVTYAPTASGTHGRSTAGSGRAWFHVTSNDLDEAVYNVAIRGLGTTGGRFDCAQDPVIMSVLGGGTDFYSVDISADPNTRTALNTTTTANFDGIALNPSDSLVYTIRYNSNTRNQLWIMDAGGNFVFAGYLTGDGVTTNSSTHHAAGSFSSEGYLYIQKNGNSTTNFYKIDVDALTSTQIILSQSIQVRDLIFNPDNNLLYGYSFAGLDGLVSIDPTNGTVTYIGGNGDASHAAMFRKTSGEIYIMSRLHNMFSVDITTGVLTEVGTAPSWGDGVWMDATSCGCLTSTVASTLLFTEITDVDIVQDLNNSWSASWVDFNGDGYDDIYITDYTTSTANKLFKNNTNGTFTEITSGNIVTETGGSIVSSWADIDNDNDRDCFVAVNLGSKSDLYLNNADETFTKISSDPSVNLSGYHHGATWADYDNDGNLDLFVCDFMTVNFNQLFKGNGNGTFTQITDQPMTLDAGISIGATWADYNNDGLLDLFVPNGNLDNNNLYKNLGNGQFEKVLTGNIVNDSVNCVASCWGDYDNDGYLDLFLATPSNDVNLLYKNNGDETFTKVTSGSIVTDKGSSHGCNWVDVDNDGDLDLFVVNGQNQLNFLYINDGTGNFSRNDNEVVSSVISNSYGTCWSDYDRDGDMDLFMSTHSGEKDRFFTNNGNDNNWLAIKLVGTNSNLSAIGARVRVKCNNYWQTREVNSQSGFGGQNSLNLHYGFGDNNSIDSIEIKWPSGYIQYQTGDTTNQYLVILEDDASLVSGVVYNDVNGDCINDSTELGISGVPIHISPGSRTTVTDINGAYSIRLENGSYTVTQTLGNYWIQNCDASQSVTISSNSQTVSDNDFANQAFQSGVDLTVTIASTAQRKGFRNNVVLTYNNVATETSKDDLIEVEWPSDLIPLSASPQWDSIYNTTTYWSIPQTLSGGGGLITIIDSASVDLTVGDSVTISASINENENELNPSDNITSLKEEVVGAIDPNDILVTPRGEGEYHYIEKEQTLTYKIRFQNVGTYYAQHVEVSNIIPYNLDLNTLKITQLSHETHYVRDGNSIVWSFKDICLPDSNQNEALSHGFIEYKIKPLSSIGNEELIINQAEIKFDFESPIKTNIVFSSTEPEPEEFGLINIYPNPALTKTILSVESQFKTNYSLVVFNQMGQEVYSSFIGLKKGLNSLSLDLSEISPGVYTVCLKGTLATFTGKLIKQ
tara:strand:- start:1127 stop:6883 length:5757 start_codon:yes stop_codon:yes gene_type:complete